MFSEPLPSLQDQITALQQAVEEIELTPGPEGPAGITPAEIAQIQAQITVLQQENAILQQIVDENRLAMEQFNPLRKLLEELGSSQGLLGDINYDGKVDSADLAIISSNWLKETP